MADSDNYEVLLSSAPKTSVSGEKNRLRMALNDIKVYNYGVVRSFLDVPPAKGNTYCIRIERTTTEEEQVMGYRLLRIWRRVTY